MGLQLKIGADFGDAIKEAKVLEGTITSLETKLTALNKTVNISLNPELDSNRLKQQIALLKDTVSEISSTIDLDSSEFQSEFKEVQKKLATLEDLALDITANKTQVVSVISEITSDLANLKANANIRISAETNFDSVVSEIRTEIASLTANATVGIDSKDFEARIKAIGDKVASLTDAKLQITADPTKAEAAINEIVSELQSLRNAKVTIRADSSQAVAVIDTIENKLSSLNISIDPSEFRKQITVVQGELNALTAQVEVTGDASQVNSVLKELQSKLSQLTDPSFDIRANPSQAKEAIADILTQITRLKDDELFLRADNSQALDAIVTLEKSLQGIDATVIVDSDNIQAKATEIKEAFSKLDFVASVDVNDLDVNDTIKRINEKFKELSDPTIDVSADRSKVESVVNEIRALLASLKSPRVNITANADQAEAEIKDVTTQITELRGTNVVLRADGTQAESIIDSIDLRLQELQGNISIDTANLRTETNDILKTFGSLNFTANVDVDDSKVKDVVKRINENLALLSDPTIDFKANKVQAENAVNEIKSLLTTLRGANVALSVSGAEAVEGFLNEIQTDLIKAREVANIPITVSEEDVKAKINDLKLQLATISGSTRIGADTTEFDAALKEVQAKIATLDVADIDLDANKDLVEATLREITQDLGRLRGSTVVLDANSRPAIKSIDQLEKELSQLEAKLKTATNPRDFVTLSKAAGLVKEQIRNITVTGRGFESFVNGLNRVTPAANAASNALNKAKNATGAFDQSILNMGRVLQDAPFGILGVANNINPLLESFQRASAAAKETGTSLSKNLVGSLMGPAGVGLAVSAVSSLLIVFGDKLFGAAKSLSDAEIAARKFSASLTDIKTGIDTFFSNLEFDQGLQKLKNKLNLGDAAEIFNIGLDKESADKIVAQTNEQLKKASLEIARIVTNRAFFLSESGQKLAESFFSSLQSGITVDTEGLSEADKKIFNLLNEQATRIGALREQNTKARRKSAESEVQIEIQKGEDLRKALEKQKDAFEKFQNETIARARQFASEFGKSFVVPELEETFFIDKNEIFKRAQILLAGVAKDIQDKTTIKELKIKLPVIFNVETRPIKDELGKFVKDEFGNIQFETVRVPIVTEFDFLPLPTGLAKEQLEDLQKRFIDEIRNAKQEKFVFDPTIQIAINKEKAATDAKKQAEDLANSIKNIFANAFQSLGEDIGNAFTGGKDLFASIFHIIGSGVEALGKQIIALGVAALSLKKALASLLANPALAIAAGVALTAIGTAMKNISGGGIKGFAEGGLVFGPTLGLIGEGFGTNRSNPEVIAPLDQLKGMLGGVSDSGGRLSRVKIRGRDLVLVDNRERRSQRA